MSEFFPNVIEEAISEPLDKIIGRSWNMEAETSGWGLDPVERMGRCEGRRAMRLGKDNFSWVLVYSR